MSRAGASAATPISVPTPNMSIGARGARQRVEIAGIEPDARQPAVVADSAREFDCVTHALPRVVGVDQQHRGRINLGEGREGLAFVVEGLHEAVRHGPHDGNVVARPRGEERRSRDAGDREGARPFQRCVKPLRPPRAEIDDRTPGSGRDDPGGFRSEHRLQADLIDDERLDHLRLPDRRRDFEKGLVGEDRGSFRDRKHVSGKAKVRQVVEQALGKHVQRPQIGDVVGAEAEACELVEKIVEATGEEEVAAFRQLADEEAERRGLAHAAGAIGAQHGEFIEIGEQTVAPASRLR